MVSRIWYLGVLDPFRELTFREPLLFLNACYKNFSEMRGLNFAKWHVEVCHFSMNLLKLAPLFNEQMPFFIASLSWSGRWTIDSPARIGWFTRILVKKCRQAKSPLHQNSKISSFSGTQGNLQQTRYTTPRLAKC